MKSTVQEGGGVGAAPGQGLYDTVRKANEQQNRRRLESRPATGRRGDRRGGRQGLATRRPGHRPTPRRGRTRCRKRARRRNLRIETCPRRRWKTSRTKSTARSPEPRAKSRGAAQAKGSPQDRQGRSRRARSPTASRARATGATGTARATGPARTQQQRQQGQQGQQGQQQGQRGQQGQRQGQGQQGQQQGQGNKDSKGNRGNVAVKEASKGRGLCRGGNAPARRTTGGVSKSGRPEDAGQEAEGNGSELEQMLAGLSNRRWIRRPDHRGGLPPLVRPDARR